MQEHLRAGPATGEVCPTLADDLLCGADAIAIFVFGDAKARRKVYYYAGEAKVRMPTFRMGNVICARNRSSSTGSSRRRPRNGKEKRTAHLITPDDHVNYGNAIRHCRGYFLDLVEKAIPGTIHQAQARKCLVELDRLRTELELRLLPARQHGGAHTVPVAISDGRKIDAPRLVDVKAHHIAEAFIRAANWKRFDKREGKWLQTNCPPHDRRDLPRPRGPVATAGADRDHQLPDPAPDGSILDLPGYDAQTGLLFEPQEVRFPALPRDPDRGDRTARARLPQGSGAALIAGDVLIAIDNCDEPLGGELLCQALTQTSLKLRILGKSVNAEVLSKAAVFATGNNLIGSTLQIGSTQWSPR